jgi:hypothetical protein
MPQFISKLQHNTYEKGEFSDEEERSLDETIELIRKFPWSEERGTDIQLTGPSVTIQDENINYLKIALYFNGKFCLYYLDNDNHLYEYHANDINEVRALVTDFFNGQLELQKFDKHIFNIGNQPHFVTNYFEYREKLWRIMMLTSFLLIYGVGALIADVAIIIKWAKMPIGIILFIVLFSLIFYVILGKIYYNAFMNRNAYLQISKGNDEFSFGYNEDEVKVYNKKDILNITSYESRGSRNPNLVEVYEINFKDNSSLKLTNMLISNTSFRSKFTNPMDVSYIEYAAGKGGLWKAL